MIPVHNHSYYSALDGYSSPAEIAARIQALGLPGAWITDHGTVAGFGDFRKEMAKLDLFAGFGMEAYQAAPTDPEGNPATRESKWAKKQGEDMAHLVLLAKSERGYRNLMRISDESNRTGFHYRPRVDYDLLEELRDGIICTSACLAGLVAQGIMKRDGDTTAISKLHRIFGDDFFIELHTYQTKQQQEVNEYLWQVAKERGIPVVYANDAHYSVEAEYMFHEAFLAAQQHSTMDAEKPYGDPDDKQRYHPPCLYIMGEDEVRESLSYLPQSAIDEAIANSDEIMARSDYTLEPTYTHLPKARLGEGTDPQQTLMDLVEDGIYAKYGDNPPDEVWDRAEYELKAIIDAGLHDYFLIVWDYCRWAIDHGYFVGPARGSSGGSILAYALDITTIDPLKYTLQFERFWNPGRTDGLPDIDSDFESANRPKVLDYLREKYDDDKVYPIGNHSYLWPKASFDKAAIILDEGWSDLKKIKAIIETTDDAGQLATWDEVMEEVGDELEPYRDKWPDLFDCAEAFSGRLGSYSIHASAVVISDIPLAEYLPARLAAADDEGKAKELVTQAEMHEVEDLGFPKFDLLRLLNLDTIMRTAVLSGDFDG